MDLHKLHGETELLSKKVLSFFIDPSVIQLNNADDLTQFDYTNSTNHLAEEDLFIGDNTMALIIHLRNNEGEPVKEFYTGVIDFYSGLSGKY